MPVPDELPTNVQRCDPEQGGCGTPFSVTLTACPNCQRSVSVEKPAAGSGDGEPSTDNTGSTSEGDETSRSDSAPELEKTYGKPPNR